MEPPVLVVIVTYNPGALLQRCVDALAAQTFSNFEVVVWDNSSTDGAAAALNVDQRFRVVLHDENVGFAAANNRAARLSASRWIATLNPDAFPAADWLERLLETAEKSGAAAVGSLQIDDADSDQLDGAGDCMSVAGIAWRGGFGGDRRLAPAATSEIFAPCAAAAIYRRQMFERVGGFEERFFCYCEDVDLGFRLRLAGGYCLIEPAAIVRHVGSASAGKQSDFVEYHGARNRVWTFLRNMPWALWPIALPAHVLVTGYVLARSPRLLKPRLSGVRDAIRGAAPYVLARRPLAPSWSLLRSLTWSPVALSRRAVKARPWVGASQRQGDQPARA